MRVALLLACLACAAAGDGRLTARLRRPHNPEQRFAVTARARRCVGARGVLVEAASDEGNGLLLWLRGAAITAGDYPLRTASDTTAGRAATASLRFMTGDIAHGLTLDSGAVRVTTAGPRLAGDVVARGIELAGLQHVSLTASFADVAITDSTVCTPT
ncbi:MAG TPA: hypothetical protein VI139_04320 [Gemmatimonadales bacterium]